MEPDLEPDTSPHGDPARSWLAGHRAGELSLIQDRVSDLHWTVLGLVMNVVDEVLGLPDGDEEPALFAQALQDPRVSRLRNTAALRLVASIAPKLPEALVTEARRAGASWQEIGDAVEIHKQSARTRWRHLDVPAGPAVTMPRARDLLADVRPRRAPAAAVVRRENRATS